MTLADSSMIGHDSSKSAVAICRLTHYSVKAIFQFVVAVGR
jgi:hypothetical protein